MSNQPRPAGGAAVPFQRGGKRLLPVFLAVCATAVVSLAGGLAAGPTFTLVGLCFTGLLAVFLCLVVRENVAAQRLVEERTQELVAMQQKLLRQERLSALGRFAGSIAHELRNPLAAIQNATYLLNIELERQLSARATQHLKVINQEIERSNRIITSLLDFAQGRPATPEPVSIVEILTDALELAAIPTGIRVELSVPEDMPKVLVDGAQMVQVFLNILVNARQALAGSGRILIGAERLNRSVRVAVTDTGPGILPEHASRLFEPMFSTKPFGVGLGLAVCKSFVEANHGTIAIESDAGRGTTVTITLPASSA
ncbi:MAG: ATP-binding protein [candidate division WOR-3 bacterium]